MAMIDQSSCSLSHSFIYSCVTHHHLSPSHANYENGGRMFLQNTLYTHKIVKHNPDHNLNSTTMKISKPTTKEQFITPPTSLNI
jgi:hypothetical protein